MEEFKNIGYIYKITNLVNGKIYIGQTRQTLKQRWNEHLIDSKHPKFPIHKAINKYGINNFKIEEIEKCDVDNLNEKEIYWINYYNSYLNGYNATLGGEGRKNINIPNKDIISSYLELKTITKVSKKFKIRRDYINKVLSDNNIEIISAKEHSQEKGYTISRYSLEGEFLEEYCCMMEAARWIYDNKLSTLNPMSIRMTLKQHLLKDSPYLGYLWKTDNYSIEDKQAILERQKESKKAYNKKYTKTVQASKIKEPKNIKPIEKKEYFCAKCNSKIKRRATFFMC